MPTLQATSELEAVNTMLHTIGEAPITSLSTSTSVHAAMAQNVLTEVSREVQTIGWHFNSESDYPITPNVDGEIVVPVNAMSIDPTQEFWNYDLTQRGLRMYDRKNHTFVIGTTIKFDITFFLPFTDLPEVARRYITVRAARVYQDRQVSSQVLHAFNSEDEQRALNAFLDVEGNTADHNIFNEYSVFATLDRSI